MSNKILIIEDDTAIAEVLRLNLELPSFISPFSINGRPFLLITALPRGTRWKQATTTI